jgi:hypothetical protein
LSFTRALIERTRELEQLLSEAKQTTPSILNYTLGPDLSAELDQLLSSSALVAPEPMLLDVADPFLSELGPSAIATPLKPEDDLFSFLETVEPPSDLVLRVAEILEEKMLRLFVYPYIFSFSSS